MRLVHLIRYVFAIDLLAMPASGPSKTREFVHPIDDGIRMRTQLVIHEDGLHRFAVSIEGDFGDRDWRRVVSFDNWGDVVHRDRYNPDGTDYAHHERMFDSKDIHQALAWVKDHIYGHLTRYVEEFKARF